MEKVIIICFSLSHGINQQSFLVQFERDIPAKSSFYFYKLNNYDPDVIGMNEAMEILPNYET